MAVAQSTYALLVAAGLVGQIINGETSNRISRTVESAAGLPFGQPAFRGANDHGVVIGGTQAGTAVATAGAGNTGNGVMGAITVTTAMKGTYRLVITDPDANAGEFTVYDPNGQFVAVGDVAAAFSAGGLAFTLADGATDFIVGDFFTIAVTLSANAIFLGLAILDHVVPAVGVGGVPDQYPQYYTAALMTQGQMLVTAGATVSDGDDVYWNPATLRYTNTTTHVRIPGCKFDTDAVNGGLVVISLRTRASATI
jgi:hypothetical protein